MAVSPPAPTPTPASQPAGDLAPPLSPAHTRALSEARVHRGRVQTAMGLAAFNGGSLLFAGLACVLGAALGFGGLWIGLLLLAFGGVELYGRGRLRAYDPVAARVLVGNQLVLLAAIWLYCGVGAYHGLTTEIPIEDMLGEYRGILQVMGAGAGTDVDSALGSVTDIYRRVIVIFYAGLALMVGLFQGGCALYYHGRVASLRALRGAPTWVHDLIGPA